MRSSAKQGKIAAAIIRVQAGVPGIEKDAVNTVDGYVYSTIGAVWKALRPLLEANELAVIQPAGACYVAESGVYFQPVTTRVIHTSGEWLEDTIALPVLGERGDARAAGEVITYARRYALVSFFGLVQEDHDARQARLGGVIPVRFVNGLPVPVEPIPDPVF